MGGRLHRPGGGQGVCTGCGLLRGRGSCWACHSQSERAGEAMGVAWQKYVFVLFSSLFRKGSEGRRGPDLSGSCTLYDAALREASACSLARGAVAESEVVCTRGLAQKYSSLAHGFSLHASMWMRGLLSCWLLRVCIVRMRVGIGRIATMRVGTGGSKTTK